MLTLLSPANVSVFGFFALGPTELIVLLVVLLVLAIGKGQFLSASWQAQQLQMTAISLLGCVIALSGLVLGKLNSQQALSICGIFAGVWLAWRLLLGRAPR